MLRWTVVVGVLLIVAAPVWAEDTCDESVESIVDDAEDHADDEAFYLAAQRYLDAWDCGGGPILAYRAAVAYDGANRCDLSAQYYVTYLESGDAEARAEAMRRESGANDCVNRLDNAIERAAEARRDGRLDDALRLLDTALGAAAEPGTAIMRAELLVDLGRCEEAVEPLAALVERPDLSDTQRAIAEQNLDSAQAGCLPPADCAERREACEVERHQMAAEDTGQRATMRTVGIVTTSIGGAFLAAAIIHDLASQPVIDDMEAARESGDNEAYEALNDRVNARKTVSVALYGTAVVSLVVGGVVWLASSRSLVDAGPDCDSLCWTLDVQGPRGETGVWLGGRF